MPSSHTIGLNYGALVGRIGSGKPFMISPNCTYTSKTDGPLYLRNNLPKKMDVKPEGTMEVKVYDGICMPIEEIYEKIGWKENNINNSTIEISELENNLILTINNLRMNPILFYEQNIRDNKKIIWTEDYLQQKVSNYNNNNKYLNNNKNENDNDNDIKNYDIQPLFINEKCCNIINDYFNKYLDIKTKIIKQKLNQFLEDIQKMITSEIRAELKSDVIVNFKLTKKNLPIDISIQYLLDKKIRNYIFDKNYNLIGVKFIENYNDDFHLVILAILKKSSNK